MRTLKLYFTGTATANAVANVVIPSATRIKGVQYAVNIDCITDNGQVNLEVSRSSATEIAVNGAQQAIVQVSAWSNFVTSGLSQPVLCGFVPVDIPMVQGQIVYGHAVVGGTVLYAATFIIHYL